MTDEQKQVVDEALKEQPIEVAPTDKIYKALACGGNVTIQGRLRMRDVRKWTEAEQTADLLTCYRYMAAMIVEWSFAGDPNDPESYDNLWQHEMRQVNLALTQHVSAQSQAKN